MKSGLHIMETEDLKCFKKIIPSLKEFPDSVIVLADDDIYYRNDWLISLIQSWSGSNNNIVFHRAHKISFDEHDEILPYRYWEMEVASGTDDDVLFPTSGGGVLYPPNSLHADVTNIELIKALCPTADDIWLYWMARRNNATFTKTTKNYRLILLGPGIARRIACDAKYWGRAERHTNTQCFAVFFRSHKEAHRA